MRSSSAVKCEKSNDMRVRCESDVGQPSSGALDISGGACDIEKLNSERLETHSRYDTTQADLDTSIDKKAEQETSTVFTVRLAA